MPSRQPFATYLVRLLQQDGRHVRQLEAATAQRFGAAARVPHNSISRWQRGEVKRPRSWQDLLKLAAVLQLTTQQADRLLQSAGHPPLAQLTAQVQPPAAQALLAIWQQSPPPEGERPFQAPPQLSHFTGREDVVNSLKRALGSQGKRRICCLMGMAGLGKTSLAIYLAYALQEQFPDGVLWLQLECTDLLSALDSIAASFQVDVSQYPDVGSRSSKVRELLVHKRALLILDNATDDAQIRPLLPPDGACAVLITTRQQDLAVADGAFCLQPSPFRPEKGESEALFAHILGQSLVAEARQTFAQIAALLGHLPLAVHIVANRLKHEPGWSPQQLLDRLQATNQRLDLLVRGDQQVRLSFLLSYQALAAADQQLFASLGIFASETFAATAVANICQLPLADAEDGLRRLYALSLLQVGRNGRYRLHPLLRDFSLEQPRPEGLRQRYARYFIELTQTQAIDSAIMQAESSNIIDAFFVGAAEGMATAVIPGVIAFYPYLQHKGHLARAAELLQLAEGLARQQDEAVWLVQLLQNLGYTAMKQGLPQKAESYYAEALALAKANGDSLQTADILLKLGALAYRRSQFEDATALYEEALAIAKAHESTELIASLLANLGLIAASTGDLKTAVSLYEEALPLARTSGNRPLTINLLQNLGNQLEARGDFAQAKTHFEEGLALAEAQNDPELHSRMLGNLGSVACHLGNLAEAAAHFRSGLSLAEKNNLPIQIYRQQANLGRAAVLRGEHRQANGHYREALALVQELNFLEDHGMILNQAGDCYLAQDLYAEAEAFYEEARQIAQGANLTRVLPMSLFGLAQVAARRGNVAEAYRLGKESRELLLQKGHQKAEDVWWWLRELPGEVLEEEDRLNPQD